MNLQEMAMKRMMGPILDMFGDGDNFKKLLDQATEKYTIGVQKGDKLIKLNHGEKVQFLIGEVKGEIRLTFVALSGENGKIICRNLESLEMKGFISMLLKQK